jgi:hypothetical protein
MWRACRCCAWKPPIAAADRYRVGNGSQTSKPDDYLAAQRATNGAAPLTATPVMHGRENDPIGWMWIMLELVRARHRKPFAKRRPGGLPTGISAPGFPGSLPWECLTQRSTVPTSKHEPRLTSWLEAEHVANAARLINAMILGARKRSSQHAPPPLCVLGVDDTHKTVGRCGSKRSGSRSSRVFLSRKRFPVRSGRPDASLSFPTARLEYGAGSTAPGQEASFDGPSRLWPRDWRVLEVIRWRAGATSSCNSGAASWLEPAGRAAASQTARYAATTIPTPAPANAPHAGKRGQRGRGQRTWPRST